MAEAPTTRVKPPKFDDHDDSEGPITEESVPTEKRLPIWAWPLAGLALLAVVVIIVLVVRSGADGDRNRVGPPGDTQPLVQPDAAASPAPDAGEAAAGDAGAAPDLARHPAPGAPDAGADGALAGVSADASTGADATEMASLAPTLLDIRSRPAGCKATVDGIDVPGLTPIEEVAVDADKHHKVVVICRQHDPEMKEVVGEPAERITLDFAPRRLAPPRPKHGYLFLDTVPWSEVFLGKKKLGMTPLLGQRLPPGTHVLTAVNSGRGLQKSIKVVIRAGKKTKIRIKLGE
jgi:hypothetical protein